MMMKQQRHQHQHQHERSSNSSSGSSSCSRPSAQILQEELIKATNNNNNLSSCSNGDDNNHDDHEFEYVETGLMMRGLLRYANLDFIYVFDNQLLSDDNLESMKKSLQQVLCHYPTLTGRIEPGGNRICLNNHGAAFRVQTLKEDVFIFSEDEEPPTGEPYCYIPSPETQNKGEAPLLTITITKFQQQKKGWTLGVVMNHILADGSTFAMFMKDWSDIYNNNNKPIQDLAVEYRLPPVVLETYSDIQQANQDAAHMLQWVPMPWIKCKIMRFVLRYIVPRRMRYQDPRTKLSKRPHRMKLHYSQQQLQNLKQIATQRIQATTNSSTAGNAWISTSEALMLHVWKLLLDAADFSPEARSCLGVSFPVNLRRQLEGGTHAPLSARLAGNVVTNTTIVVDMNASADDASADPLECRIHNAVRSRLQPERLCTTMRLQNSIWKNDNSEFPLYQTKQAGDIVFGQIPGYMFWNWQAASPYFDISFGDAGKPTRGIPWSWNQPVTVFPSPASPESGGVDVYIESIHVDGRQRGPVSWKRPSPQQQQWTKLRTVCSLTSWIGAGLGLGLLWMMMRPIIMTENVHFSSSSLLLVLAIPSCWFAIFGIMLWSRADSQVKQHAEQSKKEFYDYVKTNAHRGIN